MSLQVDQKQLGQITGPMFAKYNYLSIEELIAFCAEKMKATDLEVRSLATQQNALIGNGQALAEAESALAKMEAKFQSLDKKDLDKDSSAADGDAKDAECYRALVDTYNKLIDTAANATGEAKVALDKKIAEMKGHFGDVKFSEGGHIEGHSGKIIVPFKKEDFGEAGAIGRKDLADLKATYQSEQSMNMINIQSVMSKREQTIQLVTNLVQKMNDMARAVIGNIGK